MKLTKENSTFSIRFFYCFGAFTFGYMIGKVIGEIIYSPEFKNWVLKCIGVVKKTAMRLKALAK